MDLDFNTGSALIMVFTSVLISITFHEFMHAWTSNWLGDDTARLMGRLSLNPLKHIDPFATVLLPILLALANLPPFGAAKPVPFNPARLKYDEFGAAMVGVAGPLMNVILALWSGLSLRFIVGYDMGLLTDFLLIFTFVNIGFAVFNMIPWPPLDGSRVLYAFAPDFLRDYMRRIESFGLLGIALFIFLGYRFIAPIVGDAIIGLAELILGISII